VIDRKQLVICKGCLMKGMQAASRSVVTKQGVISKPRLFFGSGDTQAREVAEEEGWEVAKSEWRDFEEGVWFITQHWKMAQTYYWFSGDGNWYQNVNMSVHEIFRRSCQNIRDHFGVWLEVCMESTDGGS